MSDWLDKNPEMRETQERYDPEGIGFGYLIVWRCLEHWADFRVYEVIFKEGEYPGEPLTFNRRDAICSPDPVTNLEDAEITMEGHIKWDGCSEIDMGRPHWCGPRYFRQHFQLLEHLYREAGYRMGRGELDQEWDD